MSVLARYELLVAANYGADSNVMQRSTPVSDGNRRARLLSPRHPIYEVNADCTIFDDFIESTPHLNSENDEISALDAFKVLDMDSLSVPTACASACIESGYGADDDNSFVSTLFYGETYGATSVPRMQRRDEFEFAFIVLVALFDCVAERMLRVRSEEDALYETHLQTILPLDREAEDEYDLEFAQMSPGNYLAVIYDDFIHLELPNDTSLQIESFEVLSSWIWLKLDASMLDIGTLLTMPLFDVLCAAAAARFDFGRFGPIAEFDSDVQRYKRDLSAMLRRVSGEFETAALRCSLGMCSVISLNQPCSNTSNVAVAHNFVEAVQEKRSLILLGFAFELYFLVYGMVKKVPPQDPGGDDARW